MRYILLLLVTLSISNPVTSHAQQFSIAASVNGASISNFDLFDRAELNIKSSGVQDTPDIRARILRRTLQTLINEKLQEEYATEHEIPVSEKDIERAKAIIMQNNNLTPDDFDNFVKTQGVKKGSFVKQLRSQMLWQKIVSRRITPFISISEFEIDQATEQLTGQPNIREVNLYEILLPIEDKKLKQDVMQLAGNLVTEIKGGANFEEVAKEFSSSSSARKGGQIGWIAEKNLSEQLQTLVATMQAGDVSSPIQQEDSVRIFYIKERREQEKNINPQQIRDFLQRQKIDLESRRLMKQLRQKAMIEVNIR